MTKEELKFFDNKLFLYTPLPQYGDGICEARLVMTKEIFQECYKRWIESQESEKTKIFEGIVVEYPPADLCTYPEHIGKPYFSIKYEENGDHIIGFGTYKPEVLSRYLKEYFMSPFVESEEENADSD